MAIRPRRDGLGSTTSSLDAELIHDAPERRPPGFAGSSSHIVGHSAEGV
jgi:hypothetical protein